MITIQDSGSEIIITIDGKSKSYAKSAFHTVLNPGVDMQLLNGEKLIRVIKESDRTSVTPSSTSLTDLHNKVLAFFPATGDLAVTTSETVSTYAEAVPLFAGSKIKTVFVLSDTVYNNGDKSIYMYHPTFGTAMIAADFNYVN